MRSHAGVALLALVAACGGDGAGPGNGMTHFAEPLGGTRNRTFYYLNYVDELPGSGLRDYTCGVKTYDGHQGTDITLANFAVMDSGVAVRAAAAGIVMATHDGEFDRQKAWNSGAVANYVAVRHPDDVTAYYYHLKKNSVAVGVGQRVETGDLLGSVGSSGFSDIPHLHFELRDGNEQPIDPWAGSCGADESRWSSQLPYQNAFSLYDAGLTKATMTLDLAKDPPPAATSFTTADPQVSMWVELFNAAAGSGLEFRLYQPDGGVYFIATTTLPRFYSLSWWWVWQNIPGYLTPGSWRLEFRYNGGVLAERAFTIVEAATPLSRLGPTSISSGIAGGAAGRPKP